MNGVFVVEWSLFVAEFKRENRIYVAVVELKGKYGIFAIVVDTAEKGSPDANCVVELREKYGIFVAQNVGKRDF